MKEKKITVMLNITNLDLSIIESHALYKHEESNRLIQESDGEKHV